MKLGIMQPYFLPYIGYFQLINAVDQFVVYDNIKYTKKGWINRNRILVSGAPEYISLPLKAGSDFLDVDQREVSVSFAQDKQKMIRKVKEAYQKAPYFNEGHQLFETIMEFPASNLFRFIQHSIVCVCNYLAIKTPLVSSSTVAADHQLKSQERVLAICKATNANVYINPPGGIDLYDKKEFEKTGIELRFLQPGQIAYKQFENDFVSNLSILDVIMFNSKQEIQNFLNAASYV